MRVYRFAAAVALSGVRMASFLGATWASRWLGMRSVDQVDRFARATQSLQHGERWRWIHCASVGEYEQALPVIQELKRLGHPVLLTAFSPSLWEVLEKNPPPWAHGSDVVLALPEDRPRALQRFIAAGDARIAWCALVKYEVWPELIAQLSSSKVPIHLFAAHVVKGALPTRWWAFTHRKAWRSLASVKVQDVASVERLNAIGVSAEVVGDPRFDRVLDLAAQAKGQEELRALRHWVGDRQCVVAGSTWQEEEEALLSWWPGNKVALVIAPHEVDPSRIAALKDRWIEKGAAIHMLSEGFKPSGDVDLVDGIGWLSRLYALADVAIVGGEFGHGIHNVLEPAAHGVPILVGPKTERFREAQDLARAGGLVRALKPAALKLELAEWLANENKRKEAAVAALTYAESGRGAAQRIIAQLESTISVEKS